MKFPTCVSPGKDGRVVAADVRPKRSNATATGTAKSTFAASGLAQPGPGRVRSSCCSVSTAATAPSAAERHTPLPEYPANCFNS